MAKPDWLSLEETLRKKLSYTENSGNVKLLVPFKLKYPLRGRWLNEGWTLRVTQASQIGQPSLPLLLSEKTCIATPSAMAGV
ncbi:MAG: hypothetical protein Q9172_006296 [Xanthocarpia lactea]